MSENETSLIFLLEEIDPNSTFALTNGTNQPNNQPDYSIVTVSLTVLQIIFVMLGMILKTMIVYFEHFGRDSQKRSLLNRVS